MSRSATWVVLLHGKTTCFLRYDVTEITVLLQKDSMLEALCICSDHTNMHLLSPAHSHVWAFLEQWKMVIPVPKGTQGNCATVATHRIPLHSIYL